VCLASIMRPAAQKRIGMLLERGFHQAGDVETQLGYHVGQLGAQSLRRNEDVKCLTTPPVRTLGFRGDARLDMTDLYAFLKHRPG
jgi:hypothetical protein